MICIFKLLLKNIIFTHLVMEDVGVLLPDIVAARCAVPLHTLQEYV